MHSLKHPRWSPAPLPHPAADAARRAAALGLRSASAALARWACRLARSPAGPAAVEPRIEFHADAGAPGGALYVDGRLVGWIDGVSRL